MAEKTVVEYDVSQAIAQLNKLDQKVKQSGDVAQKGFNKAEAASEAFERGLGKAAPRLSSFLDEIKGLGASMGPLGVAIGGVGVAVAGLIRELVDIPELMRDTNAQFEAFSAGADNLADLTKNDIDIESALKLDKLNQQLEVFKEKLADVADQNAALGREREGLQERLSAHEEFYNDITNAARESAREREALEKRVQSIREKQFLRGIDKLPPEFQVKKLTERAAAATKSGDFDTAERLLDKAASASDKAGGFGRRNVAEEEERLIKAIEASAKAKQQAEAVNKQAQATEKQSIDNLKQEIALLKQRQAELARQRKEIGAATKRTGLEIGDTREDTQFEKGIVDRNLALEKIERIRNEERSTFEKGRDLFKLAGGTGGGQEAQKTMKEVQEIEKITNRVVENFSKMTISSDRLALDDIKEIEARVSKLRQDPGTTGAVDFNLERLERFTKEARNVQLADRDVASTERGADTRLESGAARVDEGTAAAEERLRKAREEAAGLANELERSGRASQAINPKVPSAPASPATRSAPASTGASGAGPQTTTQNITVNANVKGGIIDAEVTRAITDIVRREIRRGTEAGSR